MRAGSGLIRSIALVGTLILLSVGLVPIASADSWRRGPSRDLAVLGDSYTSGVGNAPYLAPALPCKRSPLAYGPLLAAARTLTLSFVACSGAKTTDLLVNPDGGAPQIDSVTRNTDKVIVQALGNDFFASTLEALCIQGDCSPGSQMPPSSEYPADTTVQDILNSIPVRAPALLDNLYDVIAHRAGRDATVVAPGYPDPFPAPGQDAGPYCPFMSTAELGVAQHFVSALNTEIRKAADHHGFRYVSVTSAFAGHEICGTSSAYFTVVGPVSPPVDDPEGVLHPNASGQQIYAKAVGARLG